MSEFLTIAGLAVLLLGLAVLVGTVVMLWAWNTLAVGLFGAPVMEWYHALAATVLIGIIGGAFSRGTS
jgi:hypothetical protein